MNGKRAALPALAAIAASVPAHAAVTISSAATQNMNCAGGTCEPTATKAVLNAGDLQNYLSQFGNVRVMTTGSGVEANNIVVHAPFSSPDSTSLTLEAHKAITVNAAVAIGSGTAELELQSGKGGPLGTVSFSRKGHITFGSLSDILGINGGIFTLVGSVQGLASAVAANPYGAFALANSYDAGQDGTYSTSPISVTFNGTLEGLGNDISFLSISEAGSDVNVGFFSEVGKEGSVSDLNMTKLHLASSASGTSSRYVGGMAATSYGTLSNDSVSARIRGSGGAQGYVMGGLVGNNLGSVEGCHSSAHLNGNQIPGGYETSTIIGGLIGDNAGSVTRSSSSGAVLGRGWGGFGALIGGNEGTVSESYSSGTASCWRRGCGLLGGLIGDQAGTVSDSYSTGDVTGPGDSQGGFVGRTDSGSVSSSYTTSPMTGYIQGWAGGFVGEVDGGTTTHGYWDTTTAGIDTGVGYGSSDGITGLTTAQLQSGLPKGFNPKIWAEDPNINSGLPYLIANPPPK